MTIRLCSFPDAQGNDRNSGSSERLVDTDGELGSGMGKDVCAAKPARKTRLRGIRWFDRVISSQRRKDTEIGSQVLVNGW